MAIASAAQPGAAVAMGEPQLIRAGRTRRIDKNSGREFPPRVEVDNYKASYLRM